ncbi:14500_t:CDS:2, partial [Racocetra fulgida]
MIIELIRIPNVVENFNIINVNGLLRPTPAEITYLSQEGVAQANVLSARFLQTNNGSIAASIISNLPEALISNTDDVEIFSYMRDSNDEGNYENFYKNLNNVSIYLTKNPATGHPYMQVDRMAAYLLELPNGDLLTMDNSGKNTYYFALYRFVRNINCFIGIVRIWQVDAGELIKAVNAWKKLVGNLDQRALSIIYDDPEVCINRVVLLEGGNGNDEGVGGSGGDPMNSEGRQQTFVDVENLELVKDFELYRSYKANVQREIRELHVILESIEAKEKERVWLKNQSSGDRRGENEPESGFYQAHPKKIYFVFDLILHAIKDITKEAADDYFVIVLSDANIQQYKINPEDIAK